MNANGLLPEPEAWARPFLDYVKSQLATTGFVGLAEPYGVVYASLAAGHVTGLDYFYEYAIEAYYELVDAAEEVKPLAEPRWGRWLGFLDEDAEALAAFEERLADSQTVLCAEPILAAAALGLGAGKPPSGGWRRLGYTGRPGAYVLLAIRRGGGKPCKILVPSPLYALALAGLEALGLRGEGYVEATVPDPALLRKTVYESHVAYGELSSWLRSLIEERARGALEAGDSCGAEEYLKIRYLFRGLLEAEFEYLC